MVDLRNSLTKVPLLKGMSNAHIELLAGCGRPVCFAAGSWVFREQQPADSCYFIQEGTIRIEVPSPSRGSIAIQTLGPGDVLGWSWLFPPYQWHFDAKAQTKIETVALDGRCLRGKCETDPALGYELMKRFSSVLLARLQATRLQLLESLDYQKGG